MRQLIMWNLITLDGVFEGAKKWDLDFHELVWGEELQRFSIEQMESADTLVFGRTTYEGMAAYWSQATGTIADQMNSVRKVVFSRTLDRADWNNTRLVRGDAAEEIARMKGESGKNILIFGSAELSSAVMRAGLFDEYRLCIAPVVLGEGTPLFKPEAGRVDLTVTETRKLETGGALVFLRPR